LKLKNSRLKYWEKCINANLNFKPETMLKNDQRTVPNDYTNMLNAADALKPCKNMKKMIKAQILKTLK